MLVFFLLFVTTCASARNEADYLALQNAFETEKGLQAMFATHSARTQEEIDAATTAVYSIHESIKKLKGTMQEGAEQLQQQQLETRARMSKLQEQYDKTSKLQVDTQRSHDVLIKMKRAMEDLQALRAKIE